MALAPMSERSHFLDQSFAFRKDHKAFYSTGRGREALSIISILFEGASHASS